MSVCSIRADPARTRFEYRFSKNFLANQNVVANAINSVLRKMRRTEEMELAKTRVEQIREHLSLPKIVVCDGDLLVCGVDETAGEETALCDHEFGMM